MEENLLPDQPLEVPAKPSRPWLKVLPFLVLGAIFISVLIFAAYKLGQKQNNQTVQPTPTSGVIVTSTPDLTANWKTYISLNGKYQFQYPNDSVVSEEKQLRADLFENYTYIKEGNQALVTIIFFAFSNTRYATLDDFAKGERLQRDDLPNQVKEVISIANTTAYKFKLNSYGDPGPVVIAKLNNQYVQFINNGFQNFDQILSTFKFLD